MIKLLCIVFFLVCLHGLANAQSDTTKVGIDFKPTNYKSGFEYTTNHGEKAKLLKWIKSHDFMGVKIYRWKVRVEIYSVSAIVWTDDMWIDISTGKAYLNTCTNKIVYCDKANTP